MLKIAWHSVYVKLPEERSIQNRRNVRIAEISPMVISRYSQSNGPKLGSNLCEIFMCIQK